MDPTADIQKIQDMYGRFGGVQTPPQVTSAPAADNAYINGMYQKNSPIGATTAAPSGAQYNYMQNPGNPNMADWVRQSSNTWNGTPIDSKPALSLDEESKAPPVPYPVNQQAQDQKKRIFQKLMDNLLGKPGRSFNELINGIKTAISAYKNYAKEWDSLTGPIGTAVRRGAEATINPMGAGASGIQKILQEIQANKSKDGGGGPGNVVPEGTPGSVNNGPMTKSYMPTMGNAGNPQGRFMGAVNRSPNAPPMPSHPTMPVVPGGNTAAPQTVRSPVMGKPLMGPMPSFPPMISGFTPIAGQPQQERYFNTPPPVSNLGMWGY